MKEVILDTETTGLDIKDGMNVEIGCLELDNFVLHQKVSLLLKPREKSF